MSRRTATYDETDAREIVNRLIGGMPISRVPEELHPKLLVPLSASKNEAIVAGDASTVKRIQAIMRELQLKPGRTATSRPASRASSVSSRATFVTGADDVEKTIDELMYGRAFDSIPNEAVPGLITAMKDRKKMLISQGDYRGSQQLEDLIQTANSKNYEVNYRKVQDSKLASWRLQVMQARSDLAGAEEFWKDARIRHDEEYELSLDTMEQQHEEQLEDFDKSFPEILPTNFRKLSPRVLQLREQEKHLVLTKRYEDAIAYRERADKLEAEELEAQRQKFMQAFHIQRQQLLEGQSSQKRCFERNWERKLERFSKERDNEMEALRKTIANCEGRIQNMEGEVEQKTPAASGRATPNPGRGSRPSPSEVDPRVRNVAASRMTSRKPIIRRVPGTSRRDGY